MSTTLVLQNTITWTQTLLKNAPLNVNNLEPGLTFGNWILQRITGPPARWRFNRKNFNFPITGAGTDYVVSVPDLGHIETQWLTDGGGKIHQLSGEVFLPKTNSTKRPLKIAPQFDDNQGNITFRFDSIPDQNYTAYGDYQIKPALMTSYAAPWGNVSDEFSYVYNAGFLSLAMMLVNDARFPIWENYFISAFLGAQEGLDEQAINIFIRDWNNLIRSVAANQASVNMGTAGRGK